MHVWSHQHRRRPRVFSLWGGLATGLLRFPVLLGRGVGRSLQAPSDGHCTSVDRLLRFYLFVACQREPGNDVYNGSFNSNGVIPGGVPAIKFLAAGPNLVCAGNGSERNAALNPPMPPSCGAASW